MRIHHLNCGSMCPLGGRLFDGVTEGLHAHLVCHCLLIETNAGLVLVDTGIGSRDVADHGRVAGLFRALNNVQFRRAETAVAQVRSLGFRPEDVRHIILTHLDFDHAGGLEDFPNARVHLSARERQAAARGRGNALVGRLRYRPRQWDEVRDWALYPMGGGEPWFGFASVRDLDGLPPEILLVPLAGHTHGHCGVAVDTPEGWLLHAGDAYFFHGEVDPDEPRCPVGMRAYQQLMQVNGPLRLRNQQRLRQLKEANPHVRLTSAHDRSELAAFQREARRREAAHRPAPPPMPAPMQETGEWLQA